MTQSTSTPPPPRFWRIDDDIREAGNYQLAPADNPADAAELREHRVGGAAEGDIPAARNTIFILHKLALGKICLCKGFYQIQTGTSFRKTRMLVAA